MAHKVITMFIGWKQLPLVLHSLPVETGLQGTVSQSPVIHDCRQHLSRTLLRAAPVLCTASLQVKDHFPAYS